MKVLICASLVCCVLSFSGCAGRSTSDPALKLKWASEDFSSKDNPVEAEKFIREAIDIYEIKRNQLGLAEAYRQYGLFYRSNAVTKYEEHYQRNGFLDEKVKFKDRYAKAIEYFNRSKDLYESFGHYDMLSTIYISLAKTHDIMNRQEAACDAFTRSVESYTRFKSANQEAQEQRALEIANYTEYVALMRKQAGCPDAPPPPAPKPAPLSPYAPTSPYAPPLEPATSPAPSPAPESPSSKTR